MVTESASNNNGASFFITSFIIIIFLFFLYNGINNFVFSHQKGVIMKRKNISLKEKMLERNEILFFNNYIDKNIYIEQQSKIISDLKGEYKNITDVCEKALATEEKNFNILGKLKSNLSMANATLTIRFIVIKSLKGIKAVTDFISSKVSKKKEDYFLVLNKEQINKKLESVFLSFKDYSFDTFFNGFLASIFKIVGFDITGFLTNFNFTN